MSVLCNPLAPDSERGYLRHGGAGAVGPGAGAARVRHGVGGAHSPPEARAAARPRARRGAR